MEFHDRPTSGNLSTSRVVSSFGGKHAYDGVFSGSSSVKAKTAGMDDYGEIFRGSGGSIPVLDVSELKDRNFSPVDAVRTSKIDYSKIFCGFGDDIGVPYEELVAKPTKPRKNSTPEIRVPARSESVGSEPVPSSEMASEPVDGVKQVNVLYNKTNPGCKNGGANGTTHIAQLHAVPGYTRLIDESSPSSMTQSAKPVRSVLHEAHLNGIVDPGISPGKLPKKAVSGPLPGGDFKSMSRSDTGVRRKSSRSGSISGNMSFDGFEIGLGMNSTSPPNLGNGNAGFFNKPVDMKAGVPINDVSEGADGSYSPPSFYEAIDANSAAAASAAAVIKAIEEAQAKIKFARDLMERKKEGLQNGVKLSFYNRLRSQKKEVKSAVSANRSEQEKAQKISVKEDAPKNIFTGLAEHNAVNASQPIPHPSYKKYSTDSNSIKEVRRTKSTSAQAGDRLKEPENEKATGTLFGNVGPVEDRAMNLETEQEDKAPALAFKSAENVKEMTPYVSENGYREKMASEKSLKKAKDFSKEPPALEEAPQHEKVERGLNLVGRTFEIDMCTENITSAQHEEADNKPKASCELGNCGSTLKLLQELGGNANVQAHELKEKNDMMEQKEAEDWVDINRKQGEVRCQEEMDGGSHEVQAGEELERKLDEIHGQEGNERGHKEDWVECDEELEEDCHQEKNENKESDFIGEVTQDKSGDEVRLDDPQDKEQTETTYREGEEEGNENLEEAKKDGNTLKKDYPVNEISRKQADTFELGDTETTQLEIEQMKEDRKNAETTQQYLINEKNNCEAADDKYKQNENKNLAARDEACEKENFEGVEVSPEGHAQNGRIMEVNEGFPVTEDTEKASKPAEDANVLEEEENPETAGLSQDYIELGTSKKQAMGITKTPLMDKKNAFSGETDCNFENEQNTYDVNEHKKFGGQENHTEEVPSGLDDIDEDINESEIVSTSKETVINFASYEERWSDSGTRRRWDLKNCVRDVVCKWEENDDDMKQSEANTDHEDEDYFESSSEERSVDTKGFYVETSQAFDGEGKAMEFPKEEETSQSMDKNDEHHETLEEREAEDTSKREADVENELHRRREEAKEREMEKEKERIAVERAIREARERAFAEARARAEKAAAERASAEAHQRLRAETWERLDKASADANKATEKAQEAKLRAETRERSEKASAEANKATEKVQEAKLRAERAAVERVTAEARQRALEKALSEKAASKARNKSEKFAAEKSTGTPKDGGISSSDQHYKDPGPSSSSRHPSSSINAERYNGASGESMQRSKASSEKDQRMAERAAKALAEKNMRDLLAQKEQADRNRLAETLDAEVKRWSSGKERNLRALLSTLQYILGADSGWQPIPLTELIPATAVKKAYRKATLFVHPDKLQQRGASIQQKYTCEKVFDLLKEAWNRYSAEEITSTSSSQSYCR